MERPQHILTYVRKVCPTQPADCPFSRAGRNRKILRDNKLDLSKFLTKWQCNIEKHKLIFLQFCGSFYPWQWGKGIFWANSETLLKVLPLALECQNLWILTSQRIRWAHGMNFKLSNFALAFLKVSTRTMFSNLNLISNPRISSTWRPVLPSSELKL